MVVYLIRKLEQFTKLSNEEKRALENAAAQKVRRLGPREDIIHEGDRPRHLNLMLEGWACRYKVLEDGRRQVVAFLVPGDMCDLRMSILRRMDHSIGCLSHALVAEISADTVVELSDRYPALRRALWWNSLVEEAKAREWIVNLGRRNAAERMAHLFCEMYVRLRAIGLTIDRAFELPVTQELLSDAVGLSAVHVNRTLMELREANLISLKGKTLTILDPDGLEALALFSADYLHLDRSGEAG
ncbi:MAG TPA: Crp/Fnr family transcriptional regulator [Geminicoccus sp.]|jgi:CRP-like cAMP-binding protein|uniref:Crp/Fnr family transcriptional regulator n=1 Tax=Geminicoccus sp. TaxID=2024832 RepID=UPI002E2ED1D0|nr:Crp/Fnr family transcriptional regulator [Geminicoccus sp.]HEX2527222.1 Crp/Fnr family transcriptional regulator [Geminicoccus sp.]